MLFCVSSMFTQPADSVSNKDEIETTAPINATVDEETLILQTPQEPVQEVQQQNSVFWLFFRMILVLVLVVAAFYGIIMFVKRNQREQNDNQDFLKTAGFLSLAQGKSVHVVTLPGFAWLVGVSDSAVNLIAEITDKDLVSQLNLEAQKNPSPKPKDFASLLSIFSQTTKNAQSNLMKQRERLKQRGQDE